MRNQLITAILAFLCAAFPSVQAQDLEDAIENELDQMAPLKSENPAPQDQAAEPQLEPVPVTQEPARAPALPPPSAAPAAPPPVAGDEPNRAFEERVYRIFHGAKPVSPEKWAEMIGTRREDVYHVQPGDTLWDISQTMFGDGFFWSKLWAENNTVENPHRILNGQNIRFVAGNEDTAPQVSVVDFKEPAGELSSIKVNSLRQEAASSPTYREQALKDIAPDELASQSVVEVEELVPTPDIPPPTRKSRAVLKSLPPSFEFLRRPRKAKEYDSTGLDAGSIKSRNQPANIYATTFILDKEPAGVGRVTEIELGERFASIGQNIFVRLNRDARIGERFSVFYPKHRLNDPVLGSVGPVVDVGGLIEIIAAIEGKPNEFRAAILTSVNPIQPGSIVSSDPIPKANFARRGTRLNTDVRVIGGEHDANRKILGDSSVVFLDGGAKAGLTAGDILPIQGRRNERRDGSRYGKSLRPIGLLRVIKVEPTVATAVVLETREEVHIGDRTGGTLPEPLRPIFLEDDDSSENITEN